jgi:hypothetical protein
MVGGELLLAGYDGCYWIEAGVLAVLILFVLNAWILLIEILRLSEEQIPGNA